MTLENCKRLLAHYEDTSNVTNGNTLKAMKIAAEDMRQHLSRRSNPEYKFTTTTTSKKK